jgi:hypothetical protein
MNEYHEKFERLKEKNTFKGQQWFGARQQLVEKYSWAIPNDASLEYLSAFPEILEVGAGSGYWAHCINDRGGSVSAYDVDPPEPSQTENPIWHSVDEADASRMKDEMFDVPVLMVWPPLNGGLAVSVAEKEPPHILYVGEPRGGCTAEDEFFDSLDRKYGLVAKIDIPSFAGCNDNLFHYIRKV